MRLIATDGEATISQNDKDLLVNVLDEWLQENEYKYLAYSQGQGNVSDNDRKATIYVYEQAMTLFEILHGFPWGWEG